MSLGAANRSNAGRALNGITIDVEDWAQACLDHTLPLTDRFIRTTHRVLDLFAEFDVHGTFFVLGLAAEKAPRLIREIAAAGHEVQCHGHGHQLLHTLSPDQFRKDIQHAKGLLEDLAGKPITGYRAPAFSITRRTLWALDELVEAGFQYDSSIFPVVMRRYGLLGAWRVPHQLRTPGGHTIIEVPVASYRCLGRLWPTGGGGYARLLPYWLLRRGVRQLNAEGQPATLYLHPHEFDPDAFRETDRYVSWRRRMHQGWGRRAIPDKMRRLLAEFAFGPIRDVLAAVEPLPMKSDAPTVQRDLELPPVEHACGV